MLVSAVIMVNVILRGKVTAGERSAVMAYGDTPMVRHARLRNNATMEDVWYR